MKKQIKIILIIVAFIFIGVKANATTENTATTVNNTEAENIVTNDIIKANEIIETSNIASGEQKLTATSNTENTNSTANTTSNTENTNSTANTITNTTNTTDSSITWTDFSKAEFKMDWSVPRGDLKVSNVTYNTSSKYKIYITKDNTKPSLTDEKYWLNDDLTADISKVYSLNQDLYLWILEMLDNYKEKWVVEGKKIERTSMDYANAFRYTMITDDICQIALNAGFDKSLGNRKLNIKVGKITDNGILRKIKNNESGAWQSLLTFAKTANTILNKDCTSSDTFFMGYDDNSSILDINKIEDGAYYFLYVLPDDENGKYYPIEKAITISECYKSENMCDMQFYGSEDFKWNLADETTTTNQTNKDDGKKEDTTTATAQIPKTGENIIIAGAILAVIATGAISIEKYRKYKGL